MSEFFVLLFKAIKHAKMLQDELDALKAKLNDQKQAGNLNIKMMTQEIVRMTEVIMSFELSSSFVSFLEDVLI